MRQFNEIPVKNKQSVFQISNELNNEVVLDAESMIRKAFDTDVNAGISLLFQHYYEVLCSHAVRYVSSKEIAEDIVSDIFYEFHSQQIFLSVKTSYRAFLFTCVRNRAFDYVRLEMSRSTSLENANFLPIQNAQQPDSITQFEELYQDVEKAINEMPLKRRQIYVMHRFEGKKYQEIANELNLFKQNNRSTYLSSHSPTQKNFG
jgi:RNA polymerase sigma factor (sigma-70 family)